MENDRYKAIVRLLIQNGVSSDELAEFVKKFVGEAGMQLKLPPPLPAPKPWTLLVTDENSLSVEEWCGRPLRSDHFRSSILSPPTECTVVFRIRDSGLARLCGEVLGLKIEPTFEPLGLRVGTVVFRVYINEAMQGYYYQGTACSF